MGEPSRKKLVVPVVMTVTIIGAIAAMGSCGDDSKQPDACVSVDDGGTETPCDAAPPDGPII